MRDPKTGKQWFHASDADHVVLVGDSTRIPAVADLMRELTGKQPTRGFDPSGAVARGAALQVGMLKREVNDTLLLDVTPFSLGIETKGGLIKRFIKRLIERNSTIPTMRSEVFTTTEDGQAAVSIRIYQGESTNAKHNRLVGTVTLTGLPPALRAVPKIEVTFDIDVNGIVSVSAKNRATGKQKTLVLSSVSAMGQECDRPDAARG